VIGVYPFKRDAVAAAFAGGVAHRAGQPEAEILKVHFSLDVEGMAAGYQVYRHSKVPAVGAFLVATAV
jgi:hypothetical protein